MHDDALKNSVEVTVTSLSDQEVTHTDDHIVKVIKDLTATYGFSKS